MLAKHLRTPFLTEHLQGLLLKDVQKAPETPSDCLMWNPIYILHQGEFWRAVLASSLIKVKKMFFFYSLGTKTDPNFTAWKASKYGVFSGLYSVRIQENTDQKKLGIWTLFTQCTIQRYESKIWKHSLGGVLWQHTLVLYNSFRKPVISFSWQFWKQLLIFWKSSRSQMFFKIGFF